VLDDNDVLVGAVGFSDLLEVVASGASNTRVGELAKKTLVLAYPDETLRHAADRMAEQWLGALPVVARDTPTQLLGMLTEFDLLKARQRQLIEERHRERVLTLWERGPKSSTVRSRSLTGVHVDSSDTGQHPAA
jgi:CBS-domain-containing membrane protein